jgi:hypothetical protein
MPSRLAAAPDFAAATSIAWALLAVLLALLVCSAWITPDVYYHLSLGRSVLESGDPQPPDRLVARQPGFLNVYWIWQVLTYVVYRLGGPLGLTSLVVALWLATAALWADAAGLLRRPALGLPLGLAGVLIFQSRLDPRPEAASYLLMALQVRWLSRWDFRGPTRVDRRVALFFGTTVLWTNVHGYFALAPLLVGARLASAWSARGTRDEARPLLLLAGATLAATFVSPFGLGAWKEVFVLGRFLRAMRPAVMEFSPPLGTFLLVWTVWIFWAAWAATAIVLAARAARRSVSPFAALLALAGLTLSASAARNMPLLPILAAPLVGQALLAMPARRAARSSAAVGLAALALSAWIVQGGFHRSLRSETRFGIGPAEQAYADGAAAYLERIGFRGTVFNDAADGGYLEFRLPGARPYMDSRYTDAEPVTEYFRALREPEAFARLDEQHRFDAVLLKVSDSPTLVRALLPQPAWRMAYADLHRTLFLRRDGPHADAPSETARLYHGEDLTERVHGRAAIQWFVILRELGRRDLLMAALADFGRAPRIPSPLLQVALEFAARTGDVELRARAAALRPRMVALRAKDRDAVDRLLAPPP